MHNSKKINKNKIIYKEKEESEESEITELNILKKEEKEESTSEKPQNKIENDDAISNILQKIQINKKINEDIKIINEGISKKTTNDQTTKKNEDSNKKNNIKFIIEKDKKEEEEDEIKSETDNSLEEVELNITKDNSGEKDNKESDEDKKKDNSRKEALKAPIPGIKQIIEKVIGKKLEEFNLNQLFGGIEQNKKILRWKMYQIFCFSKKNRKILRDCEPSNEKDKEIFYFILTRRYKFLFNYYYLNKKDFDGKIDKIENFPILNEIIEERKNKIYKKENEEQKVNNFKDASKSVYMNFKDVKGRGKCSKKLKKVTLTKFEDYLVKES